MKSLKLHFESLLDDDVFFDSGNEKKLVEEWIRNNYKIDGNLTISDDLIVDCNNAVKVKNKSITSLTNGPFRWGKVNGDFDCSCCSNIKNLEGAPKKVGGRFWCNACDGLETLKGAPKEVIGMFSCSQCNKLTSLKGSPEKVGGSFYCGGCEKLTSLEGVPEKIGGGLYCFGCKNIRITHSDRKKYKIDK